MVVYLWQRINDPDAVLKKQQDILTEFDLAPSPPRRWLEKWENGELQPEDNPDQALDDWSDIEPLVAKYFKNRTPDKEEKTSISAYEPEKFVLLKKENLELKGLVRKQRRIIDLYDERVDKLEKKLDETPKEV